MKKRRISLTMAMYICRSFFYLVKIRFSINITGRVEYIDTNRFIWRLEYVSVYLSVLGGNEVCL